MPTEPTMNNNRPFMGWLFPWRFPLGGNRQKRLLFLVVGILAALLSLLAVMLWPLAHSPVATPPVPTQVVVMTLPSPIFRRWVHSREEDQGDIRVYRPITYAFPPARMPRDGLEFRQNGEFIRYQPGPSDRSVPAHGRWQAQTDNRVEVRFSEQSAPSYGLTIVECDGQVLKIRETQ